MLVSSKHMLQKAKEQKYAVPAFNIHNFETLKAVVEAAQEENSPLILQTTPGTCEFMGIEYIVAAAQIASKGVNIPIALHLDHCNSVEIAKKCIDLGYTSVMIDGSQLPFEENASLVKEIVDYAHSKDVQVEAELGRIVGTEDDITSTESAFTCPSEAVEFVKITGVDSLAIAIGTAHGVYRGKPNIHFDILEEINKVVSVPLVLHGCSGVPEEDVKRAIKEGISKINIATDIKIAFSEKLKEFFTSNPNESDPRKYFKPAIEAVKNVVKAKIKMAEASNKA